MLRIVALAQKLRQLLDIEDVVVMLIPQLIVVASAAQAALGLDGATRGLGPLNPLRLLPMLAFGAGLWVALATRVEAEERDWWTRLHIWAAWAGLVLGVPLLLVPLTDGDTGIVLIYATLFFLASASAAVVSRTRYALELSPERRRVAMRPFVVGATWFATDKLVGSFLYDKAHVAFIVEPLMSGDPFGLFMGLVEAGFIMVLLVVPYILLVIFPRFIVGEIEAPWVWIRRYGWFTLSVLVGLLMICAEAVSSAGEASPPSLNPVNQPR